MPDHVLLAKTWNRNESGQLWERLWYREGDRFFAKTCASGLFVPPQEYPDEEVFWAAFENEQEQFYGAREAV